MRIKSACNVSCVISMKRVCACDHCLGTWIMCKILGNPQLKVEVSFSKLQTWKKKTKNLLKGAVWVLKGTMKPKRFAKHYTAWLGGGHPPRIPSGKWKLRLGSLVPCGHWHSDTGGKLRAPTDGLKGDSRIPMIGIIPTSTTMGSTIPYTCQGSKLLMLRFFNPTRRLMTIPAVGKQWEFFRPQQI